MNTIREIKREDSTYVNSDVEILDEEYKYYKNLYDDDEIPQEDIDIYLKELTLKTLSEPDKNKLEGEITEAECEKSLQGMKLNKSPGGDGLPIEFYKAF